MTIERDPSYVTVTLAAYCNECAGLLSRQVTNNRLAFVYCSNPHCINFQEKLTPPIGLTARMHTEIT